MSEGCLVPCDAVQPERIDGPLVAEELGGICRVEVRLGAPRDAAMTPIRRVFVEADGGALGGERHQGGLGPWLRHLSQRKG
eukprot:10132209-Heterocapsa_arctica.AAC.1